MRLFGVYLKKFPFGIEAIRTECVMQRALDLGWIPDSYGQSTIEWDRHAAVIVKFVHAYLRIVPPRFADFNQTGHGLVDQDIYNTGHRGFSLPVIHLTAGNHRTRSYPTISTSLKKKRISVAAVSGASEPWTELRSIFSANDLRIVPSAASAGLVAPITSR